MQLKSPKVRNFPCDAGYRFSPGLASGRVRCTAGPAALLADTAESAGFEGPALMSENAGKISNKPLRHRYSWEYM
jgi:hypothetical protein